MAAQRNMVLSGAHVKPAGPTFAFRVVGVEVGEIEFPATNVPAYSLNTTRAFARTVNQNSVALPACLVQLRRGPADRRRGGRLAALAARSAGEARLADPSAGFSFDGVVLLPGALVVIAVFAPGLWSAIRTARIRPAGTG